MVKLNGYPVLQYQIENLKKNGIEEVILVVGYLKQVIMNYFGDGTKFGIRIIYYEEKHPLGTAGALYYLKDVLSEQFLLVYGDVLFDMDIRRLQQFHQEKNARCSLVVHTNAHPFDSDLVVLKEDGQVKELLKKNEKRDFYYHNCVNSGVFLLNREVISYIEEDKKQDLEKDIIAKLIQTGCVYGYKTTEYLKDMGTPERYQMVQDDLKCGIVAKKNLSFQQKAVFLDRDGTINQDRGLVAIPEDFVLYEEVYEAMKLLNGSEYLVIVITNQPVIARNLCSLEQLDEIHRKLETKLGLKNVYVDDIYYCPHHPHKGYPEENPEYKIECTCRKPKTGMIEQAVKKYNISTKESYFVGDTTIDIQTGKNAGLKTILVKTGRAGMDGTYQVQSDVSVKNIYEAASLIVNGE